MFCSASIIDGIEAVMDFCRENRSAETTTYYQRACDLIVQQYEESSLSEYDPCFHEILLNASRERILGHDASTATWFERYMFRTLSMLKDFHSGNPFKSAYLIDGRFKHRLLPLYESWAEMFRSSLVQKPLTVPVIYSIARDFFYYLQEQSVQDFSELTHDTFYSFLMFEYKDHSGSMGNVIYVTRLIADFIRNKGYYNVPEELMPFSLPPSRRRVLPALTYEDAESIFNAIDLNTASGKRDFAMLMLAFHTGLRSIDIANLLLTDINWTELTIQLVQHKTVAGISLPLDSGVAATIADYILNARPKTDSAYVFVTESKPYRKLCDKSSVSNVFNKYVRLSGIVKVPYDGKTFHAIRRSMGAWLLKTGARPELISQILGHQDKTVLRRYLPIEQESLIICALDFSGIPVKSEVYV